MDGTPGGGRIITAVLHTIINVIDYGTHRTQAWRWILISGEP
jgi:gamma-glutamyltranspeptidase